MDVGTHNQTRAWNQAPLQNAARPEGALTHNAAIYGSDETAKASGLQYTRIWVSAGDSRVRPGYAAAHARLASGWWAAPLPGGS